MALLPLNLTLFGRFEARYEDRPLTGFATDKVRALLAYLAVESGKPHRRETLAALLWPDYPEDVARGNLRKSLYRLRQTLQEGDPDLPEQLLSQTRQTVTLHPEVLDLDTVRFNGLVQAAKETADPLALFTQIADLYQGELLRGFSIPDAYAFEEWLTIQRELFHQSAVDSLTRLLAQYEAGNDPDGILTAAVRVLVLDPWHERTHRQIMRAQRQKGNRPGAIAQYNVLRETLLRDLGVEPSQATNALYEQIRGEAMPVSRRAVAPAPGQVRHLPVPLTPLIGRKEELDHLTQMLQDSGCRLLSLTGPGGIGKTRLCIEAVRRLAAEPNRFGDGLVFIPLAQVEDGDLLVSTVGQRLDLAVRPGADRRQELLNYLTNRHLLLVLDNFEQLLDQKREEPPEVISLLLEALAAAPGVTFFVTTREPLALQGEWVFSLEGLPYLSENGEGLQQPAPQLFVDRARRVYPSFDPAPNAGAIMEICRLTDGLPLALEIAASWMRAYDPPEIAERIAQSLDFLTSPYRDVPARQRSIRAVMDSAWEQLTGEQQKALAATAVLQGRFTVRAALAVAQVSVLDLALLVEKSLLRRAGERRYQLHELVRAFAAEKLQKSGAEPAVRARHADYYFAFLREQLPALNGANPQEAIATISQASDNVRAAWQWAATAQQITHLARAMNGLAQFLVLTSSSREGEETFAKALDALGPSAGDRPDSLAVHSQLLAHLAWFQSGSGKNQTALANAEAALALAKRSQDGLSRARALSIHGWILQTVGRYDDAEAALSEAVALFDKGRRPLEASLALIRLGSVYWRKREFEKTLHFYRQSLQIEERLQNKRGINRAAGGIGLVYVFLEQYEEALEWLNKALALDRELGNRVGITRHLGNLGSLYVAVGHYEEALACYHEAIRIDREFENKSTLAIWLGSLGGVYRRTGDEERALDYYQQAITMAEELGDRFNLCESLLGKGEILTRRGEWEAARQLIARGRALADDVQRTEMQFRARLLEARWLARTGSKDAAYASLEDLLGELGEEGSREEAAQLYYELWQIDKDRECARAALEAYRIAAGRVAKAQYRSRIEELERALSREGAGR